MAKSPFTTRWVQAGVNLFQWSRKAAYWKGLPVEARRVPPGQVWAIKDPRFEQHQILVVEVKKKIAVVYSRVSKATPWKGLVREPRTLSHLPRLYRLVGIAKVPGLTMS